MKPDNTIKEDIRKGVELYEIALVADCGLVADSVDYDALSIARERLWATSEQAINQHALKVALELIGINDTETRGTTQNPDNEKYLTRKSKARNELRAELIKAFSEYYGGNNVTN